MGLVVLDFVSNCTAWNHVGVIIDSPTSVPYSFATHIFFAVHTEVCDYDLCYLLRQN